jgi:hypothetical protein
MMSILVEFSTGVRIVFKKWNRIGVYGYQTTITP